MLTFEPTHDLDLVRSLILPEFDRVRDDFAPKPEAYYPPVGRYLLAKDNGQIVALWSFSPHYRTCWEVHTILLPQCRGKRGVQAWKEMLCWIWANTECRRITTEVPEFNRAAAHFARWVGLERIGVNRRAFQRDGKLQDVVLWGISPEV